MKVSQVRRGVLAAEFEHGDDQQVTVEGLRERGWGPAVLDIVRRSQARRAAVASKTPDAQPDDDDKKDSDPKH